MSNQPMLWHYTVGDRLNSILREGVVRPATASIPRRERPLVWLSANQDFEPTARKAVVDPNGFIRVAELWETCDLGGGLARLGISKEKAKRLKFLQWPLCARRARTDPSMIDGLAREGRQQGADPLQWWGGPETRLHLFDVIEVRATVGEPWAALTGVAP